MGKNKKKSGSQILGATIIKDRFAKKKPHRSADSFLHTSELDDGYEWGRLQNLQSVTEQNQLDDFLATAELAGTEFTAEKLNIEIVSGPTAPSGILTESERIKILEAQEQHKTQLRIPRRPQWHGGMSADELKALEREEFLEWRRSLAALQELEDLTITPFERNLDFWRQLWRVIERSDVVVQIVDSRNPLLFRCEDLEAYVKEVDPTKVNVILINKSDFLTEQQRQHWCDFFNKEENIRVFFWSAKLEADRMAEAEADTESQQDAAETNTPEEEDGEVLVSKMNADSDSNVPKCGQEERNVTCGQEERNVTCGQEERNVTCGQEEHNVTCGQEERNVTCGQEEPRNVTCGQEEPRNMPTLYGATELVEQLKSLRPSKLQQDDVLTIGMVGYPNVGKSSTINAILQAKKCPVSTTPGRTKHFQTLYIDTNTMLCDCPGLVMPSFVTTKGEMILAGILPIDQMRDHKPATNALTHQIPRESLEITYGITIRKPKEGEDPKRPPTDLEVLNAYGAMRGFMTSSGVPDCPRSSRILLKDYVNGKLLYCEAPPGVSPEEYVCSPVVTHPTRSANRQQLERISESVGGMGIDKSASTRLDHDFFEKKSFTVHAKGARLSINADGKIPKRHGNRHKSEKTRRLYSYLDQHDNY